MTTEETVLKGILSVIEKISNVSFQKKAWIANQVHPYAFFEESMHQLFDDYDLKNILNNYKSYKFSDRQYQILSKFYEVLDWYSDEKMSWIGTVNPKQILSDPKWHEIQIIAKEVLTAFDYLEKSTY